MSALLFNMVIDWVMRKTTEDGPRGIRWNIRGSWLCWRSCFTITYPSPFAREDRNHFASQVGLKLSQTKTEVMTLNITNPAAIHVEGKDIPITEIFTYLGSTVRNDGDAGNDLLRQCNQESMATILIRRRWKWIGHVIRRDQNSITKTSLHWTPEGKRKRRSRWITHGD